MVRGKFFVMGIRQFNRGSNQPVEIMLGAVGSSDKEKSENNYFHQYTPSGEIKMTIDNPSASDFFALGKTVYVDFTEAPAE